MPDRAALEILLRAYRPSDPVEEAHRARMLALVRVEGDPFARDHFVPGHFTASSFVLSCDGERLLLIEHAKLHRWLQPGGHVDPKDSDVLAAARRELREEAGLEDPALAVSGIFDLDVHAIPAYGPNPRHEHFDVRFLFQTRDDRATAGSDAKAARWVELASVERIESDDSVMRAVAKLRARHGSRSS